MKNFSKIVEKELAEQRKLLKLYKKSAVTEKGHLRVMKGKKSLRCYFISSNKKYKNITRDHKAIKKYLRSRIGTIGAPIAMNNIKVLEQVVKGYSDCDEKKIVSYLPESYKVMYELEASQRMNFLESLSFEQCPKNPEYHIHKTISGETVRSKSEVIIANTLTNYGIKFHYEERFPYPDEYGRYLYPDFTIILPNGEKIYWEHFGMLGVVAYCEHNANKLYHYHINGLIIGKNLIITQDDNKGSCNSDWIDTVVREQILPYFT